MIRAEDFDFHFDDESHWQWAETVALPFALPEENINVILYLVTRPRMGVCMSDITILDRISDLWEEQLYIDNQQHLPCPETLLKFDLPNGLSFEAVESLKHYRVHYSGIDDTSFDLDFKALGAPYDINDPDMDPTAAARNGPAWDASWSGHYEQTFHVTGTLTVRGRKLTVDSVSTGDRSWGTRPERENSAVIWWNAAFGKDLAIHLFAGHDIANRNSVGPHISGYVLENGEVFGITDSSGIQNYRRAMPTGGHFEITDVRGKSFDINWHVTNGCYWSSYPSNTYLHTSHRCAALGREGYGIQQMGLSRAYLTRHRDAIQSRY